MTDSLRVAMYVSIGLSVFGFIAGVTDGMNGGDSIATGSIMWIGLIGLAVIGVLRYKKIKSQTKPTPI